MTKPRDNRYTRFKNCQLSLEALLSKLEAQGDFDANAPTIRQLAVILLETMVYVRHLKGQVDGKAK